jgi:hypothetical protein
MSKPLITITMSVDSDGNITEDTQCHDNPWAETFRGMKLLSARFSELMERRRECPFNPKYGAERG